MKKYLTAALILTMALVCFSGSISAEALRPFTFPFIGKWEPSSDPLLIGENGFQDIQNLRRNGLMLKGVSGHTKINTSVISTTYSNIRSAYHFVKDQPAESHVLVVATDSTGSNYKLMQNETAIPDQGNFSATVLKEFSSGANEGLFSKAPQGNVIACNGEESLVWGGDELKTTAFINYNPDESFKYNYTFAVNNTSSVSPYVANLSYVSGGIDENTVLMIDFDNEAVDASTSGHTVTVSGMTYSSSYPVFGSHSGYFDGNDYISVPDHADFDFSDGTFSIDYRGRMTNVGSDRIIYYQESGATDYIKVLFEDTGDKISLIIQEAGVEVVKISSSTLIVNTFYHIKFVENGDSWYCFVDGKLKGSLTDTDRAANYTGVVYIGDNATTAGMLGQLDEFRVSKSARHISFFEIPSEAYTDSGEICYLYIGSPRQLDGFKLYVSTANDQTSSMTVYNWGGTDWDLCTNIIDGTASGGVSLAQTGSVTFDSTVSTAKQRVINNMALYFYKVIIDDISSTTAIYYSTVSAPIQPIKDVWNASNSIPVSAKAWDDSASLWLEYSDEVVDDTTTYYFNLDDFTTSDYMVIGFIEPQQGFYFRIAAGKGNSTANTVMSINYWAGNSWVSVGPLSDGTASGTVSLAQSGAITFTPVTHGSEFLKEINDELGLYYYAISFDATLDAEVEVYNIGGIVAPYTIGGYKIPVLFQGRSLLLNEKSGMKNKMIWSAYNTPDVWNGTDSGITYFGDEREIVAAGTIYNLFRTEGFEQLIVCKTDETYRISGNGPEQWQMTRMSDNVGCIAPHSMVACEAARTDEELQKNIIIWQTDSGVVKTDGAFIESISNDISCYWDRNDARAIPTDRLKDSYGSYDKNLNVYKLLISSGAGQTTHNVELEFSLETGEWTKLYRENGTGANPYQTIFKVEDTDGKSYTLGTTDEGTVYRTENSATWNGTAIEQYVQTKDLMLDSEQPFFKNTTIELIRFIYEQKTATETIYEVDADGNHVVDADGDWIIVTPGESITLTHYADRVITTDATYNQDVPERIDYVNGPIDTQSCMLGPALIHSFKISSEVSTVTDGMEISGLGLYFRSDDTITMDFD